jgi:hypothetical protein
MNKRITFQNAEISALENYDTNGCTDFTDFTDSYGFFLNKCLILGKKIKKSVGIGEIRKIRTSVRIVIFQNSNCCFQKCDQLSKCYLI